MTALPQIEGYIVLEELGYGGMSDVYRAVSLTLHNEIALKLMAPYFREDSVLTKRFEQEASIANQLEHPNIVPVYDVGEHDGRPYLVMRYMSGGTFRDRLQSGALSQEDLWPAMEQIASALDSAHARDIVHRDIKPTNILFDRQGNAYVADFGIAQVLTRRTRITKHGSVGTPHYMSPEQYKNVDLTGKCDQYSLAIVIFEALTGRTPFDGSTSQLMYQHLSEPPPAAHLYNDKLPEELTSVLERALDKNPDLRFPTVSAFVLAVKSAAEAQSAYGYVPVVGDDSIEEQDSKDEHHESDGHVPPVPILHEANKDEDITKEEGSSGQIIPGAGGVVSATRNWRKLILMGGGLILLLLLCGTVYQSISMPADSATSTPTIMPTSTMTPTETSTPSPTATIRPTTTPLPTSLPAHSFSIIGAAEDAVWRSNDSEGPIAPGEVLNLLEGVPINIVTNNDGISLALSEAAQLHLDSEAEVQLQFIPSEEPEEPDVSITLISGLLLLQTNDQTYIIKNPFGASSTVTTGAVGLVSPKDDFYFEAHCLVGGCAITGDIRGELVLEEGEFSFVGSSGEPSGPAAARYELFRHLSDIVPLPTATNTPTATSTPTPTPTQTPTFVPLPTFTPIPSETPVIDTDGDGVNDIDDLCKDWPGPADNNGCPKTGGGSGNGNSTPSQPEDTKVPPPYGGS